MDVLMRRCLLLVSFWSMACFALAAEWMLPLEGRQQFLVTIEARGAVISGICVVKTDAEGSRGAIVNEFGVHALDFTVSADRKRVKLLNVMPAMNRWYIRRVVRRDLQYLFAASHETEGSKGHRTVTLDTDGTVMLVNAKYKLNYSLKKIDETEE